MKPVATPQGSPAPTTPQPGATKRPRTTAVLSDVTNLLLHTRTPTKPRRTGERRAPSQQQQQQTSDAPASASTSTSTCSSSASVTPAPKPSSAAAVFDSVFQSPAISTVYARRVTTQAEGTGRRMRGAPTTITDKGKGKELAVAATPAAAAAAAGTTSCPQLGKSTGNRNRKTSMARVTRPISSSAPCAKKKRPSSSTPKLPEDFVKKQRAYFAEIDAFELPEEEASESDLD